MKFRNSIEQLQKKTVSEVAATMVEYAILVAFISIICIAGIRSFSNSVNQNFSKLDSTIDPHFFGG